MTQRPVIPPYAPRPGNGPPISGVWIGLAAGAAISAVVWGVAWHPIMDGPHGMTWLIAIPLAKLVIAVLLTGFAETRTVGAGLLLSIGLGILIFFGSCFAHL